MCYICKNKYLEQVYQSLLELRKQEEEHTELKELTISDYIQYKLNGEGLEHQYQYDYLIQKRTLLETTTFKFKNKMNVVTDKPCSTEHANIIQALADSKYITIEPRGDELFGSLTSWGKSWRNGF